jgi:SAM-dependent methyltransferase
MVMNKTQKMQKDCYPHKKLEEMRAGKNYTDWILSFFRPWLKGVVCEVGAGNGNNVDCLLQVEPERLILLEPDVPLYRVLKEKFEKTDRIRIANTKLGEYGEDDEEWCDAFFYMNVLEHVEDDEEELRMMYSRLRPGGAVLIFVPALPFLYSNYDKLVGHWRRYTKSELQDKIQSAGFELIDVRYVDFVGVFAWLLFCKILKSNLNSSEVGFYDRVAIPLISRLEKRVKPVVGKNLLAVAIKK